MTHAEAIEQLGLMNVLFDLQWKADRRAIEMWQAQTGKTRTWPDSAKLSVWLLERLDAAERVLEAARKQSGIPVPKDATDLTDYEIAGLEVALHLAAYDQAYPPVDVKGDA